MARILIVDDNLDFIRVLQSRLEAMGHTIMQASSFAEAIDRVSHEEPDLILLDIVLPGKDGIELLKDIRARNVRIPVIMMTAYPSLDTAREAMRHKAFDYLMKPFEPEELKRAIEDALERRRDEEDIDS